MNSFAHLSVHTEFSIIDSVLCIEELAANCKNRDIFAIAITDYANLFGFWQFQHQLKAAGIKPIFGVDLKIIDGEHRDRINLLAKSPQGWANLRKLMTVAYLHSGEHGCIEVEHLQKHAEDLIVLSGGTQGQIGRLLLEGSFDEAEQQAKALKSLYGDHFYLELHRTRRDYEEEYASHVIPLAAEQKVPLVATNDVRFLNADDFSGHEARFCIAHKQTIGDDSHDIRYSSEQYLKSASEMAELFRDLPDALENAVEIAYRCTVDVPSKFQLPQFKTERAGTPDELITSISHERLDKMLDAREERGNPVDDREVYIERLNTELDVIKEMGFSGYFLIVGDFVTWAKNNTIPVGPGRGSGSASLVAYVLGIIDIDPIQFDLMFERLLNTERVSMPDFDIDFCMNRRGEVIDYVTDLYGRNQVAQIVSFNRFGSKTAVRDVTRVLGKPFGLGDRIAKLIPLQGVTPLSLEEAVSKVKELKHMLASQEEVTEIIELAKKVEGLVKTTGRHAAGVVIAPTEMDEYVPVYTETPAGDVLTQLDKQDVEALGLVKFDFLGLKTVTAIDGACALINANSRSSEDPPIHILDISLDDPKVFASLQEGHTTGIFQLESSGMRQKVKELKPTNLEDIIALQALYRPGPLDTGVTDSYIRRKNKLEKVKFDHPIMEKVLAKTYGLMVYQEDVMNLARELAGFSMGHADVLRQAMGKKNEDAMLKLETEFVDGCLANGVRETTAKKIYADMRKFAGYAFNRAHAASYALVAYQTAYLRTHYPAEYLASLASCETETNTVKSLVDECRRLGVLVQNPSVNESEYHFLGSQNSIIVGLRAITQLEEKVAKRIIEARKERPYQSLMDLCVRARLLRKNKTDLERLIYAGALDCLEPEKPANVARAELLASIDTFTHAAEQAAERDADRQIDMFGTDETSSISIVIPKVPRLPDHEMFVHEESTLGFFLSGHPLDSVRSELLHLCSRHDLTTIRSANSYGTTSTVAGIVKRVRNSETRSGKRLTRILLEDEHGGFEFAIFDDSGKIPEFEIGEIAIAFFKVQKEKGSDELNVRTSRMCSISERRCEKHAEIEIDVDQDSSNNTFVRDLREVLMDYRFAGCTVRVNVQRNGCVGRFELGEEWRVNPTASLMERLYQTFGIQAVRITY